MSSKLPYVGSPSVGVHCCARCLVGWFVIESASLGQKSWLSIYIAASVAHRRYADRADLKDGSVGQASLLKSQEKRVPLQ